jgi:hypothetical protein
MTQILLHHPDDVGGNIDGDGNPQWTVSGRPVDQKTFLHRRVNPMPGRVQGFRQSRSTPTRSACR